MQFKIFKNQNIIQGISDVSFGSMVAKGGDKNATRFLKSLGYENINQKRIVWAEQVFGSRVHICKAGDSGRIIKNIDGLLSNIPGQVLAVVSADCLPILLSDPKNQAVGAFHGARASLTTRAIAKGEDEGKLRRRQTSSTKGIIKNAIGKMVFNFGSNPQDILVGIGPGIRRCHYWLKEKTYQQLKNTYFKKYFLKKKDKIYFDLTQLVFDELLKTGIQKKKIEDSKICTFCSYKKYFSARKEKEIPEIYSGKNPRFASFIGFKTPQILRLLDGESDNFIKKATESIKKGEILVCPTDTVYGLIADATNKKAVEKLFKIKKRNLRKPIPIFVKDLKVAKKLACINKKQEKFLRKVWPGKVTLVLKRKKSKIKIYGVDKKTIALRIPNYRFLNILLLKINRPLTGTSANISGKPNSIKIKEVLKQFENKEYQPDLILDAGNLLKSLPSTIISLVKEDKSSSSPFAAARVVKEDKSSSSPFAAARVVKEDKSSFSPFAAARVTNDKLKILRKGAMKIKKIL